MSNNNTRKKQELKRKRRMRVIRNRCLAALVLVLIVVLIILLIRSCGKDKTPENPETNTQTETNEEPARKIEGTSLTYNDVPIGDSDLLDVIKGTAYVRTAVEKSDDVITPSENDSYIIRVNLAHGCTTVYQLDSAGKETPIKAFACSVARDGHETPEGEYYLDEWYDWCYLADGTYGQYAYRLVMGDITDIMFHSVPYLTQSKDNLEWGDYDKLGSPASLGCIRMSVADVRWICKNVGHGVHVIVYSDPASPGPLGKPGSFFVPWDAKKISGWDPTDPDTENPWHKFELTFSAPDQITIPAKDTIMDLTPYLSITDNYGNDLAKYASFTCNDRQYGFSYSTVNQEDIATYPEYEQSDLVKYDYTGIDVSTPGTYDLVVSVSIGPVKAYRALQIVVVK